MSVLDPVDCMPMEGWYEGTSQCVYKNQKKKKKKKTRRKGGQLTLATINNSDQKGSQ